VKRHVGFSNAQLLQYVWWDAVGGAAAADSSLLVGLSPTTLMQAPTGFT
jgi:hypothetical protein